MITRSVTLDSNDFFHARPAADAKDPLSLMRLSHPKGSAVDILADGTDEQKALDAVVEEIRKEFSLVS